MEERDISTTIEFVEKRIEQLKEDIEFCKNKNDEDHIKMVPHLIKYKRISETVFKTLLREKPKKLERYGDGYDEEGNEVYDMAVCPNCHREFEVEYTEHCNYCPSCGQKLDWSEVEREREEE